MSRSSNNAFAGQNSRVAIVGRGGKYFLKVVNETNIDSRGQGGCRGSTGAEREQSEYPCECCLFMH